MDPVVVEPGDKLVVYTQGWLTTDPVETDDEPITQLHCRVAINGHEIPSIASAKVTAKIGEFVTVQLDMQPGTVEFVPLTHEQWNSELPLQVPA